MSELGDQEDPERWRQHVIASVSEGLYPKHGTDLMEVRIPEKRSGLMAGICRDCCGVWHYDRERDIVGSSALAPRNDYLYGDGDPIAADHLL
jgi:hypothetical protein